MSDTPIDPNDLCIVPAPRTMQILEGNSDLCGDARLVTANVLPLQRKTIRSVLAAAGIRVVANKKKFIIEIQVVPPEKLEMDDVPEALRENFYELELRNNVVTVRTASQVGALWGAQTLGWLYRSGGRETVSRNFRVRDWSSGYEAGMFVDMARGSRYMLAADWEQIMDRLALFKMTHLAVRVFGRPPSQGRKQADLLCLPSGDEETPELAQPFERRWFSVGNREWQVDSALHQIIEYRMWADLVTFANERGIVLAAVVDPFGRHSQLPRVRPDLSAVDEKGGPTGTSFCLSNPDGRAFLDEFFGMVLERDYPKGLHPVHLDVSEAPLGTECSCDQCRATPAEERCLAQREWFVGMLKEKGVPAVWLWDGDEATPAFGSEAGMFRHPSVSSGADAETIRRDIEYVRVDDNDPLDFVPLSRFAAAAWHRKQEEGRVSEQCVADVVLAMHRGQDFLRLATRLRELDMRLGELTDVSLYDCRHRDGIAIDVARVAEYVGKNEAADFNALKQEGEAIRDAAMQMMTEEDRGTTAEIFRTMAGFGTVGGALADFAAALRENSRDNARNAAEAGILAAQEILPRWLENTFVDEFSQVVAQFG